MAAAVLGFLVLPMITTATIASFHHRWCGRKRVMGLILAAYCVGIVIPQYLVARYILLPMDADYNPLAASNFAWALVGTLLGRIVDLGFGPGRLFVRCWAGEEGHVTEEAFAQKSRTTGDDS